MNFQIYNLGAIERHPEGVFVFVHGAYVHLETND